MENEIKLEDTAAYQLAMMFKPFLNPKCGPQIDIVENMAKSILRLVKDSTPPATENKLPDYANDENEAPLPYGYSRLKGFIESRYEEGSLNNENTLDEIIGLVRLVDGYHANKGFRYFRINHNPIEKAFHEQWLKENEPTPGFNYGNGILQDLFIEREKAFTQKWNLHINDRDRYVVATVIQWLGTNVGMCFLEEALKRVSKQITDIKD